MSRATKSQFFSAFFKKFIKRQQNKFNADTMSNSKAIRSKKSKCFVKSKFLAPEFVFFNILLTLQQHIDVRLQVFMG